MKLAIRFLVVISAVLLLTYCSENSDTPVSPQSEQNPISKNIVMPDDISGIKYAEKPTELSDKKYLSQREKPKLNKYKSNFEGVTSTELVSYTLFDHPVGWVTSFQDLTFTGSAYSYNDNWYGVEVYDGATIELPETAESFVISPWTGYEWYGYYQTYVGVYNESGELIETVDIGPDGNGYGINPISYSAPAGEKIKYLHLSGYFQYTSGWTHRINTSWWYYLDVYYSSCEAPTATAEANKTQLWPPNNKEVSVTFSGDHSNECADGTYTLTDEYGEYSYSGTIVDGAYSVDLKLKASRNGNDKDGRKYTFTVTSSNESGSVTQSVDVVVPHSKGK